MILGRLVDTAENGGRQIMLNGHEVSIEGIGSATFSDIAAADARGEIVWTESAYRTWIVKRATEEGWAAGAAAAPEPDFRPAASGAREDEPAEAAVQAPAIEPEPAVEPAPALEPTRLAPAVEPAPARSREGKEMMSPGARIAVGVVAMLVFAAAAAAMLGQPNTYTPVQAAAPTESTAP